jgi:hypothetical protein
MSVGETSPLHSSPGQNVYWPDRSTVAGMIHSQRMPSPMKGTLSRLSTLLLFAGFALAIGAGVRSAFRVEWSDLIPALFAAVAIQWGTWEAMAWARRRFRPRNDPRASILIAGLYCAALVSVGMYYVGKWRLVDPAGLQADRVYLPTFILVGTIVGVCLFSLRGTR